MLTYIAIALGGLYLLANSKKKSGGSGHNFAGIQWDIENAGTDGKGVFFDVYAPAGSFGPHARLYVLRMRQEGDNPPELASRDEANFAATPAIYEQAVRDLGITGA